MLCATQQDKNPVDKSGWTPLHSAAQNGHVEVCRLILDGLAPGQRRNPVDSDGWSAVRVAQQEGHAEVVALLEEASSEEEPSQPFSTHSLMRRTF